MSLWEKINSWYKDGIGSFTLVCFLALFFFSINGSCNRHVQQSTYDKKDSIIVFFNIQDLSREELALVFERVSLFHPKVVGVEAVFPDLNDFRSDSLLASSFMKQNKIILASYIDGKTDNIIKSHDFFRSSATTEGVISYIVEDDGITTEYVPLFENHIEQALALPIALLFDYDKKFLDQFTDLRVNDLKTIQFYKEEEDFLILSSIDSVKAETIGNKILIFSAFDESAFTYSYTDNTGKKKQTKSGIITANIILNRMAEKQ